MTKILPRAYSTSRRIAQLPRELEKVLVNQGRILSKLNASETSDDIADYEFKIFSQWGEDGILQHLVRAIPGISRTFIEFGVEDFSESNCRFLMTKDNWSGFIIDGSADHVQAIRNQDYYWKHDLTAISAFIDKDNVQALLEKSGFGKEIGILSVDIDGVDFHVLQALAEWRPSIIVVEYNGLFGAQRTVSVPYDPKFSRLRKHHSGLYWGASLPAFATLLKQRGYGLVGTNSVGSNAFFVRLDQMGERLREVQVSDACRPVTFRDCRSESGELLYISQQERLDMIGDLPLVDTVSGDVLRVSDLGLGTADIRASK